ncbi:preprotein translocase subunit SecA [Vulgatibacter incomptus]|uniref:Protein translocase subunit SecA n=1 Tax=Vulgatibacter incomptus TaxID=1391653 RepID=A0A0K1P9T4_9BACT|nr:preprotein translocase subunit SecA [Vulgatibacter incomptus]AKU90275.1 Protein export cytoplasm protein SecA ATPase RNA helicase [Vulgatibacter incomptus]
MFDFVVRKLVGTKNQRELKKLDPVVARINELETRMKALKDEDFARQSVEWKQQVANGRKLDDLLPEAFAACREAGRRVLGQRHFDVQLIGGMVLHSGRIAEMRTGEGKTLTATLPSYLNALEGRGVHVVTVNDYLARRDSEWMGRVHRFLGLSVGCVLHGLTDAQRQDAYRSDITYGQNNEFGFDYLRDNMKFRLSQYVQRELNFAIVDEVDSILIDEARTPLIISGPSDEATDLYYKVDKIIPFLVADTDFVVDEKARSAMLTDEGVEKVEHKLAIPNLYDPSEIETLHHVEQALRAHALYRRDKEYVVQNGEVLIVDEFTGRIMPGRRWSDGLHQAIEAKEGVKIEAENQTLATISFQNYFRMYTKLSGMTGTADTEAPEFASTYNLDVVVIPTNRPMVRKDRDDIVYKTEREKFNAVADEIAELNAKGQPILVGTVSIAKSEALSSILKKRGIRHDVLNAKQHEREANIVAQAGRKGAVTIATNMAGRGTDIILGGNAEALVQHELGDPPIQPIGAEGVLLETWQQEQAAYDARKKELLEKYEALLSKERSEVMEAGGLAILGTERHESRRIDNQLRGRAGRQGDAGLSRFYLSLEDDLMRIFASDRIARIMETLGMQEGEPIEHKWLTRSIASAQKRVEAHHFDSRKNVLEYDDVMNQQRKTVYRMRREVLASGAGQPLVEFDEDPKTKKKTRLERTLTWDDQKDRILDFIDAVVSNLVDTYAPAKGEWDAEGLSAAVRDQFGFDFQVAGGSQEQVEDQLFTAFEKHWQAKEENLGLDTDGVPVLRKFEQWISLQSIDANWKDHLLQMDHLRQGIGLRGYGQKDPKAEYKKEGFNYFQQMAYRVQEQVAREVLRLQVITREQQEVQAAQVAAARAAADLERKIAEQRKRQRMIESHADLAATANADPAEGRGGRQEAPRQQPTVREAPKVGRNDPCPCGSGKKYKKCHGTDADTSTGT